MVALLQMPGTIMAMGHHNKLSIMINGRTIKIGHVNGHTFDIASALQIMLQLPDMEC